MLNLMRQWLYINTKCQANLRPFIQAHSFELPQTYISKHLFLGNHWDCLGHLTKMGATPIYGKTKYVSLLAVVNLDLFYNYKGDQVSASGPSGPLVMF